MRIVKREGWGAASPKRPLTPWKVSGLEGVVVHWFGKPSAAPSHAGCPRLLRAVQRAHKAGEFTDIAYNHAVCPHGIIYELRGFGFQTGANGTTRANREYAACVVMMGVGDRLTGKARRSLATLIREYWRRGAGRLVRPHGYFTGSTCPGPELTSWVATRGYLRDLPRTKPPKPTPSPPERFDVVGPKGGPILHAVSEKTVRRKLAEYLRRFGSVTVRRRK